MQGVKASVSRAFGNPGDAFDAGSRAAFTATGGKVAGSSTSSATAATGGAPDWAQRLRREQGVRDAGLTATHVIASGDRGGSADAPRLREDHE
jgi:type IV secretion system protein TrbL